MKVTDNFNWKNPPPWIKVCGISLLLLIAILIYLYPLITPLNHWGRNDWNLFLFFRGMTRISLLKYHQLPQWTPYFCGGTPLIHNPQVLFFNPGLLFVLLFGAPLGLKFEIVLMFFMGAFGFYYLGRKEGWSVIPSIFVALLFIFNSFFSLHYTEGHLNHLSILLLPFLFHFFDRSSKSTFYVIPACLFSLWMIASGGFAHVLVPAWLFLGVYAITNLIINGEYNRLVLLTLIVVLTVGVAAVKILPVLKYLSRFPRPTFVWDYNTPSGLVDVFLNPIQSLNAIHLPKQKYRWHEYGAYVGVIPFVFFFIGSVKFFQRRSSLLITGFVFLLLSMGNFFPWAPWPLLHELPGFNSMRVPSRFIIYFVFILCFINGDFVDWLWNQRRKYKWNGPFIIATLVVAIINVFFVSREPFELFRPFTPTEKIIRHEVFRHTKYGVGDYPEHPGSLYQSLLANRGVRRCQPGLPVVVFARHQGEIPPEKEVYVLPDGKAEYEYWSPNKLVVNVRSTERGVLIVNQNYHRGWKRKGPKSTYRFRGFLATTISPDTSKVVFVYEPTVTKIGAAVSLLSLLILGGYSIRNFYRR